MRLETLLSEISTSLISRPSDRKLLSKGQLTPFLLRAPVAMQQGVSCAVDNAGKLMAAEKKTLFHAADNECFKTVAIWQVMSEKTEKALGNMREEAKKQPNK